MSTDDRTSRQTTQQTTERRVRRRPRAAPPRAEPGPRRRARSCAPVTPVVSAFPDLVDRRPDRPPAAHPRVHPRLGGAPRLPAERARDRRGGRPGVAVQRRLPAQGAGEEGLPAPRPQPAARRRRPRRPASWSTTRTAARARARPRPTCRCSAGSPPVGRSSPSRPSRTSSRCPASWSARATLFMLQVKGDSMLDAAICDGDWVVVRQQPTANAGDIVAAMLDGEATVKTYRQPRRARLADAAEPGLRPDPRRRRHHHGPGRGGAPPDLTVGRDRVDRRRSTPSPASSRADRS